MSKYAINDTTLIAIGDAIREKEGSTDAIPVADFADRIAAIQTGGGGSSSGLPTPPEGGWTYSTSPWNWKTETLTSTKCDVWVFDVSNCNTLTITYCYIPNYLGPSSNQTGYRNYVYYSDYYGYSLDWETIIQSSPVKTQIDDNAKNGESLKQFIGTGISAQTTGTLTFDVADYSVFSLRIDVHSKTYSSAMAIYVKDISYT